MTEEWKENTQAGFNLVMIAVGVFLVFLFVIPTAFHIIKKSHQADTGKSGRDESDKPLDNSHLNNSYATGNIN